MHILILFLSGISLGFAYILEKKLAQKKFHPATLVVLVAAMSALISSPLLLYQFKVAHTWPYWILALGSIIAYGLGNLFAFKAYALVNASVVGLINRLNIVFTVFIGILFLAETYRARSYFGLLLILIGSLMVVYKQGRFTIHKGIVFAVVTALGYGLAAVFDKVVLREFSPFTYIVLNNFLVALLFSTVRQARSEAWTLLRKHTLLIVLISLFSASSWIGFLYVLQSGAVSKIFPIYDSLALVCTVTLGIFFLKEKGNLIQKVAGTIAVITGIFLLG